MSAFQDNARHAIFGVVAALVLSFGLAASEATMSPAPASASGTHCAWWGPVKIERYTLPTGQYCFTVSGQGRQVTSTSASFNTGWITNPAERVQFYNQRGVNYATFWTYNANGKKYGYNYWRTGISGTAEYGRVCGELLSSGSNNLSMNGRNW